MGQTFVSLSAATVSSQRLYEIMAAVIQPRPIAFVSTVSVAGVPNLAPFSFFMPGGSSPPSLVFSVTNNSRGEPKDSLRNIRETGEFVVNSVHRAMAEGMNMTSPSYAADVSEWRASGFTPLQSESVKPHRVEESLVHFECRLYRVIEHGSGPNAANYVIGEISRVHVSQEVWNGERIILGKMRTIGRMGGPEYVDTGALEIFAMARPKLDE